MKVRKRRIEHAKKVRALLAHFRRKHVKSSRVA
jgi:hypothetical protein